MPTRTAQVLGVARVDDSDETMVEAAKAGDPAAMEFVLNKYRDFVRMRARSYFVLGGDREDVLQEGMIGLYKAIRDFRSDKLVSFRAFADLCIKRQIITAVKGATRLKHVPLNQSVSLNRPAFREDGARTLLDVLPAANSQSPEGVVVKRSTCDEIREQMKRNLSPFETAVLALYLQGQSYQEMSAELSRGSKSIDNALQRLKRKIHKNLTGVDLPLRSDL